MTGHRRAAAGGFTFVEMAIATAVALAAFGSLVAIWGTSDRLASESYTRLRAEAEHRRNLQGIASVLRDASADTLAGLDLDGRSATPRFKRITGLSGTTVVESAEMSLAWTADADGSRAPSGQRLGEVRVLEGGTSRMLARDVPEGGFSVQLVGRRVVVALTSQWRSPGRGMVHTISGTTELTLRN